MRGYRWGALLVTLGFLSANLQADEVQWRKVSLATPVPAAADPPASKPVVRLGKPRVLLGRPTPVNAAIRPTALLTPEPNVEALHRGQDNEMPLRMPTAFQESVPIPAPRPLEPPAIEESRDGVPIPSAPKLLPPADGSVPDPLSPGDPGVPITPGPVMGECLDGDCVAEEGCFGCIPFLGHGCCSSCGVHDSRLYGSAEYLLWWTKSSRVPPLVTTSPVASQGIPGMPGTTVLLGDQSLFDNQRDGGRFTLGWWFDRCHCWGVDTSFFFLGDESSTTTFNSFSNPVLARPFFNPNPLVAFPGIASPGPLAELVSTPGDLFGSIGIAANTELWGIDTNLRRSLWNGCCWSFDVLTGFRYLRLEDDIRAVEQILVDSGTNIPEFQAFNMVRVEDQFNTTNDFYGGQVGFRTEYRSGRWSLGLQTKIALGSTRQTSTILGSQVLVPRAGMPQVITTGGLLAVSPGNIGTISQDEFTVVPEVGLNLGYQLTPRLRFFVGYNFLYWSNVLRAADQIPVVVDAARVPTFAPVGATPLPVPIPGAQLRSTDFWAQGISFGLRYVW